MKKVILLIALSVLLCSATGHTMYLRGAGKAAKSAAKSAKSAA